MNTERQEKIYEKWVKSDWHTLFPIASGGMEEKEGKGTKFWKQAHTS